MKNFSLGLVISISLLGAVMRAQAEESPTLDASKQELKELKKEEKRLAKERKRIEKAKRKEAEALRADEKQKEELARKDQERKEKEMREANRRAEREQRRLKREQNRKTDAEKEKAKAARQEREKQEKKLKSKKHQQKIGKKYAPLNDSLKEKQEEKLERVKLDRQERKLKIEKWDGLHTTEVKHDIEVGRYADLYKLPSWPVSSIFYEGDKNYLRVSAKYYHATDSYGSSGGSSRHDITALEFGEKPFSLKDVSLASKLVKDGYAVTLANSKYSAASDELNAIPSGDPVPADILKNYVTGVRANFSDILTNGADKELKFDGKTTSYGMSLDYARYLHGRDVLFGVQIPVVYVKNNLKYITPRFDYAADAVAEEITYYDQLEATFPTVFRKLLEAKGINEMGGSKTGIGDIVLFGNVQLNSTRFDKMIVGAKLKLPTANGSPTSKLWAPALGNGGFAEFSIFGNVLFSYKPYLNPHVSLEATYVMRAHQHKRVPRLISFVSGTDVSSLPNMHQWANRGLISDFAFSDRVKGSSTFVGPSSEAPTKNEIKTDLSVYDSTVRGFGDNVCKVKYDKGPEFDFKVGNMVERFILRRAFLDLFYDLHVKGGDHVSGLSTTEWNTSLLEEHTSSVAHKIGLEWTYQFDTPTRLHLGASYVFAGTNTPKAFEALAILGYSF